MTQMLEKNKKNGINVFQKLFDVIFKKKQEKISRDNHITKSYFYNWGQKISPQNKIHDAGSEFDMYLDMKK